MIKIAHISDTHIRNLKYHKVYRKVFKELYQQLEEIKPDIILHTGDVAHSKTNISPEFVDLTAEFLSNLADIAPTHILLGNHDGSLSNNKRQDAISPVANALQHPNIHLYKDTQIVEFENSLRLHFFSLFDGGYNPSIPPPVDDGKINVAVYHGPIKDSMTDLGWKLTRGLDRASFEQFDFVMLGDVHRTNQIMDENGRVRYPGSTIQQNFGETNDKGYLLWQIEDCDNFTCELKLLANPSPFVNVALSEAGGLPEGLKIQIGAKVRLVATSALSASQLRKIIDVVKTKYLPVMVTYISKYSYENEVSSLFLDDVGDNLRDVNTQERLIKEYLSEYEVKDTVLERVYELNRHYNDEAEAQEDVRRNIRWKMKNLSWDNYFNFGENNYVDFTKIGGLRGIFGKNYIGKSSVIDSLLFTIFNSISKKNRKNVDIINQNKDSGRSRVEIEIDSDTYVIERTIDKYTKKLKGIKTKEARVTVNFYRMRNGKVENLNGDTRTETEKNIRKYFGTIDDFLLTFLCSQIDNSIFIDEGSTKRREILARFLDLDIFEKKFLLAKQESNDTRALLKNAVVEDFVLKQSKIQKKLKKNEARTKSLQKELEVYKIKITEQVAAVSNLKDLISSEIAYESSEILTNKILLTEETCASLKERTTMLRTTIEQLESQCEEIKSFIVQYDEEELQEASLNAQKLVLQFSKINTNMKNNEVQLNSCIRQIGLLKEVPCGWEFSHCKFIKDAYEAKDRMPELEEQRTLLSDSKRTISTEYQGVFALKEIADEVFLKKEESHRLYRKILEGSAEVQENEFSLSRKKRRLDKLRIQLKESLGYEAEATRDILKEYQTEARILASIKKKLAETNRQLQDLYRECGSLTQQRTTTEEKQTQVESLKAEYAACELFLKCMHNSGISYNITKEKLPLINQEISHILSTIVEFEIFFENDGKRLNILIKQPLYDPRPIEMASGAEKTIASMAIRLALINVTNLPKSNLFVMDEPAFFLDEENMEGFSRLLEVVRNYFDTSLLISHLDVLKDTVDSQISIKEKNGFAYIRVE